MRRTFVIVFISCIFLSACIKNNECKDKTPQSEQAAMTAYAAANGITGSFHSSGVYYQVTTPGSGPTPSVTSQVSIRYTGKLMDGSTFDSQTGSPVTFGLSGTIPGFQIGLQLVQKGGVIKMIIPSSMAYGCAGSGSIPGNSILFFEVQLVDVL